MRSLANTEARVERRGLAIFSALLLFLLFRAPQQFTLIGPDGITVLIFGALVFLLTFLKVRGRPVVQQRSIPGVLTVGLLVGVYAAVFVLSKPGAREAVDLLVQAAWPLLVGAMLGSVLCLIYLLLRR
jgi:hypothetical protein